MFTLVDLTDNSIVYLYTVIYCVLYIAVYTCTIIAVVPNGGMSLYIHVMVLN